MPRCKLGSATSQEHVKEEYRPTRSVAVAYVLRFVKGSWGLRGPGLLESWGLRESVVSTGVVVGMVVVMAALTADVSGARTPSRSQPQPSPSDPRGPRKGWPPRRSQAPRTGSGGDLTPEEGTGGSPARGSQSRITGIGGKGGRAGLSRGLGSAWLEPGPRWPGAQGNGVGAAPCPGIER